jgi:C1A family cysteine protease
MADTKRYYGWKPSLPDPTAVVADPSGLEVLDEVDPRGDMAPCYDQGQLGSCTGNAVAGAVHYENILNGTDYGTPSRLFIYWWERYFEGTVEYDSGAYGHDGFRCAKHKGVPPEELCPYNIKFFRDKPSEEALAAAQGHKIGKYVHPGYPYSRSIQDRTEAFKALLSNKQTIAFGFTVYESFESEEAERTGIIPLPDTSRERQLGGHEVLLVGYLKDYPEHGLVRNSWGTEWGMDGYCLMPWKIIAGPGYADDWRSIYRPA